MTKTIHTQEWAIRLSLSVVSTMLAGQGLAGVAYSQGFGNQHVISTAVSQPRGIHAADMDGDGDLDVIASSLWDSKVVWCENIGSGNFGPDQLISDSVPNARGVHAHDLDGDGDMDVLAASEGNGTIAWFENLGGAGWSTEQLISWNAIGAKGVMTADLDGDGDEDILSASAGDYKIAWYENLGGGAFGSESVISDSAGSTTSINMDTADFDGDGDLDVVSAGSSDGKVLWSENQGSGIFAPPVVIALAPGVSSIAAVDLNGDGAADLITGTSTNPQVSWHENQGNGNFGPKQVIVDNAGFVMSVSSADLDGDGDADILSGMGLGGPGVLYVENLGGGSFASAQALQGSGHWCNVVLAADLDGDGDADALSAEAHPSLGGLLAWYENGSGSPFESYCPGLVCPCGNAGDGASGCTNSGGAGATLSAHGSSSASADDLNFSCVDLLPGKPALLFSGLTQLNAGNGVPFGDGLRCVGGQITRLEVMIPNGSGSASWGPGYVATYGWPSGATRTFQTWYRDPAGSPCGSQFNLSNGLGVTLTP